MATQRIPLVDLKARYRTIQAEIDAAMKHGSAETAFIMGPDVAAFEAEYADLLRRRPLRRREQRHGRAEVGSAARLA